MNAATNNDPHKNNLPPLSLFFLSFFTTRILLFCYFSPSLFLTFPLLLRFPSSLSSDLSFLPQSSLPTSSTTSPPISFILSFPTTPKGHVAARKPRPRDSQGRTGKSHCYCPARGWPQKAFSETCGTGL